MSRRRLQPPQIKPRLRVTNKSIFNLQDDKEVEGVLTDGMIKSAKRTGQLTLCNKGLGKVPEKLWKIDEIVLEESKDVDFNRMDGSNWWSCVPLHTLDLSSNAIVSIPADIKYLQELVTLKLHDNALSALPPEIGEIKNLSTLTLDHNKLKCLPKQFHQLTELRWLSISHNQIEKIEPDFGDHVMLNYLDLSHNKIPVLPPGLGYLVRLVDLNLSHNELCELPPDIVNLRDLKKLDISHNHLKSLPAMGELRKMQILDANHNDIEKLPDFLGCSALKEIYLANNEITEITEEFCDQMQHLNSLVIRDNKLSVLPDNISLLQNLRRLDVTNNDLNKLPRTLGLLCGLQALAVEGNRLRGAGGGVGGARLVRQLRDAAALEDQLDARTEEDLWPDTFTMRKCQSLSVSGRGAAEVPARVWAAAAGAGVISAHLARNRLTDVTGISQLSETLTQLDLSANGLESLPLEVCACVRLQFLDLAKNRLTDLPQHLERLADLKELVLSNNRLASIPEPVYSLAKLEILLASENQVEELDVGRLRSLGRLAVLQLANNNLRALPNELGHMTQLRSLEVMGNVFRQPRHAILEKGTESILAYLRDRIPKDH